VNLPKFDLASVLLDEIAQKVHGSGEVRDLFCLCWGQRLADTNAVRVGAGPQMRIQCAYGKDRRQEIRRSRASCFSSPALF
jgi:hypothetical protein